MPVYTQNKNKGFTLMELVAAIVVLALMSGLTLAAIASIQHTKVQHCAQTLKSKCEATREIAKSRGTNAELSITVVDEGLLLVVSGNNLLTEETTIDCKNLTLFYKKTGPNKEQKLSVVDNPGANGTTIGTISIVFSGENGNIINQPAIEYIVLSNGSKNYKLIFKHNGGLVYYDYEADGLVSNNNSADKIKVYEPYFTKDVINGRAVLIANGKNQQPEFAYNAQYVRVKGEYRASAASDIPYTIIFELKDPYSTTWADGTTEPKTLEWIINKYE